MSSRSFAACTFCIVIVVYSSAHAALIAFWQQNTITPAAITNDPTLANMQSWSVMVQNPQKMGFWFDAGLRATLPPGKFFYRNPLGGNTRPSADAVAANPALAFQTYVTSPRQTSSAANPPGILGNWPPTNIPSFGGQNDSIPGTFTVNWVDPQAISGPVLGGPFEIARLTFPVAALPDVWTSDQSPEFSYASQVSPEQMTAIPEIPEPRIFGWLAAGVSLLGRRRRD